VLVEQNTRLALDISPRTVVMNRGRIIYDGLSEPLKQSREQLDRLIGVGRHSIA
jgi:branched-chain amino acid transport system ATP-binding protein